MLGGFSFASVPFSGSASTGRTKLAVSGHFKYDFQYDLSTSQDITWNSQVCIPRFYRVVTQCVLNRDCPEGTGELECIGGNTGTPGMTQKMYQVMACDVNEVCRKLIAYGIPDTILHVHQFEPPVFGPNEGIDPACLKDVTPTTENCIDCCDLLVDEKINFTAGISGDQYSSFLAAIDGTIQPIGSFSPQPNFVHPVSGGVGASSNMVVVSSAYHHSAAGGMLMTSQFGNIRNNYIAALTGDMLLTGHDPGSYKHLLARIGGTVGVSGSLSGFPGIRRAASGRMTTSGSMNERVTYITSAGGVLEVSSGTNSFTDNYFAPVGGRMSVTSDFEVRTSAYDHTVAGAFQMQSRFGVGRTARARGGVLVSGGLGGQFGVNCAASGGLPLSSEFVSECAHRVYQCSGAMVTTSDFEYICSDLGIITVEAGAFSTSDEVGIIFGTDPAPAAQPATANISLTGCCSLSIQSVLQFRHNLGQVDLLSKFLKTNGYTLPGATTNSEDFTKLIWHSATASWRGNIHFQGTDPSSLLDTQVWDIVIEFGCRADTGALNANVWTVSMLLRVQDSMLGINRLTRLVLTYDVPTVCPSASSFGGFTTTFNTQTVQSTPATLYVPVFADDEGLITYSPLFIKNPDLVFSITPTRTGVGGNYVIVDLTQSLNRP